MAKSIHICFGSRDNSVPVEMDPRGFGGNNEINKNRQFCDDFEVCCRVHTKIMEPNSLFMFASGEELVCCVRGCFCFQAKMVMIDQIIVSTKFKVESGHKLR